MTPSRPPRQLPLSRRRNRRVTKRTGPGMLARTWQGLRAVLPWLLGVALLAGAGVGGYVGWQKAVASPRLRLRAFDVRGTKRTNSTEVVAYTGAKIGQPILTLDLDAMALSLRRHPWIRSATVRRRLPDRLIIEVVEHAPTMFVSLGELYVADEDGQPFKTFAATDKLVLPVITGMDRDDAAHRMAQVVERIRAAIGLAEAVDSHRDILGELEELHWDVDLGWSVVLTRPAALRIHLGQTPVERLPRAVQALQMVEERHQLAEVIWADGQKNPDRVQVQLAGGAGSQGPVVATPARGPKAEADIQALEIRRAPSNRVERDIEGRYTWHRKLSLS